MLLKINNLSGEVPIIPEQKIPDGTAYKATNCHFRSGTLVPYRELFESEAVPSGTISVKYWRTETAELCLKQSFFADYVPGVVGSTDVLYVSGGSIPEIVFSSGTKRAWGVDAPQSCIGKVNLYDLSASPSPLAGTWGTTDYTVDYVYTCVDEYGRESAPSPPTAGVYELDVFQSKYCMLAYASLPGQDTHAEEFLGFQIGFPGSPACSKRRIYRAEVGDESVDFLFLAEVDATVTEFTDFERVDFIDTDGTTKQRGQLKTCQADALQTDGYIPPSNSIRGIRLLSSGSIAGFNANSKDLCFSHPAYQYAFPSGFNLKMPQIIRQIEVFGDDLVVFMDSHVCVVRGEPGFMSVSSIPGVSGSQCGSGRAAVVFEAGVLFPGHDGLYLYSGGMCENITKNITSPEQWQTWIGSAEPPFYFHAVFYDNKYMAFRTGDSQGRITVFDLKTATMHTLLTGFEIKGIYTPKHGHLGAVSEQYKGNVWVIGNSCINKIDFSTEYMSAQWISGIKRFPQSCSISSGLIISDYQENISMGLKITAGLGNNTRSVIFDKQITPNIPFRLPGGKTIDNLQAEVTTNVPVHEIILATSIQELSA